MSQTPTHFGLVKFATQPDVVMATTPAAGDMLYFDGAVWTNLPAGTAGQYLAISGGLPTWTTAGGGPDTDTLAGLSDVSLSGTAQGDLLYRGAATWTTLAHGTSGQVLISGGAAANPSWSSTPTLGALTLNGNLTLSGENIVTDTSTGTQIGTTTTQ